MPFYIITIVISFLASLGALGAKKNRTLIFFSFAFFLFLSAIVEYIGWRMSAKYYHTLALYNFFTFFEFIFYLFFFRALFDSPKIKRIIFIVIICYFICTLVNILFFQGRSTFHTYTYLLGCTLMVIFSIVYFNLLLRVPETGSLIKNPFFWIVAGLLVFYTCNFTLSGLDNYIAKTIKYYTKFLFLITDLLNTLLYTLFTIGFLCKMNFRKLTSL
jgi:hypothetical protein